MKKKKFYLIALLVFTLGLLIIACPEGPKTKKTEPEEPPEQLPDRITIFRQPTKRSYIETQTLDLSGMEVRAFYFDEETWDEYYITLEPGEYTTEPEDGAVLNTAGSFQVKVIYKEQEVNTLNITVTARALTSLTIIKNPDKMTYNIGDTFDPTGMEVEAAYNTLDKELVTTYDYSPKTALTVDTDADIVAANFGGVISIEFGGRKADLPLKFKQTSLPIENIIGGVNSQGVSVVGVAAGTMLDFWNRAHWTDFSNTNANLAVAPVEGAEGTLKTLSFTGGATEKLRHDLFRIVTPDGTDNIYAGSSQSGSENIGNSVNDVVYRYTVDVKATGTFSFQFFSAQGVQADLSSTGAVAIGLYRNAANDGFELRTVTSGAEVIAKVSDAALDYDKDAYNRFDFVPMRQEIDGSNIGTFCFYINNYRIGWENVDISLHSGGSLVSGNFRFPVNLPNYGHRFCVVPDNGVTVTLKQL